MTAAAWITFAVIAGFVWGGALLAVTIAMRKERGKASDAPHDLWVP